MNSCILEITHIVLIIKHAHHNVTEQTKKHWTSQKAGTSKIIPLHHVLQQYLQ